ncbi:MAG: NADH dehydrogenase [Cyclobacteriaceae bacterium]|jgi:NADH dehydrogenase
MQELNIPTIDLPRVVILGGGFAGLKLARNIDSDLYQVVVIDRNNYHTFQPLLYQVATAGLEPDSIAYPLRKILKKKKRTHIRMAEINALNLNENSIDTSIGKLSYDYLVIATGAKTNYFGNQNIEQFAMPMKTLSESLDLRSYILRRFEAALNEKDQELRDSMMNFVVVGGGPTGVELAGALSELKHHILPKDFPDLDIRRMQIHVIEAGPKLLAGMSDNAAKNAFSYLKEIDVNVWLDTMVSDFDGQTVSTNQVTMQTNNLIWAAGVQGNIPEGIPEEVIEKSRLKINEDLKLIGYDNVFAMGDVALLMSKEYPKGYPMLGSVAQQQGSFLATYLKKVANGQSLNVFKYKDKGTMATIGRNKAVVDLGKFEFGGFIAWLAWLFVHLMLLVDFRNRLIVFFNWVWSYVNYDRGTRLITRQIKPRIRKEAA